MIISLVACGETNPREQDEDNINDVSGEAASDMNGQEAVSFVEENTTVEVADDTQNLLDDLEEGEMAMIPYDEADVGIAGSIPDIEIDINALRETNPDICAYIYVPGTSINNAILKRDDSNEYYLEHNEEDESDKAGCICMDMGNETSFTDPVTCLYARSGEGEPFGDLIGYLDPDFMNANQFIYIYSDEYINEYRVFASYETDDTERLLVKYNFYDYSEYQSYIDEILSMRDMAAVLNTDLRDNAISTWNIITLTAIDNDGSRQLVQAVYNGRAEY